MRFYLGSHHVNWLAKVDVALFISRRVLWQRKTLPEALGRWALDSGGFTELNLYGRWVTTEDEYVADVLRFEQEIGGLDWVAPQDWMCEPFVLSKTGGSIEVHQRFTVDNFLRLRDQLGELVIPVLQGWTKDDYQNCWGLYEHHGVDLADEPLVGLGTVCRRQNTEQAATIVESLQPLRLHGFGVKTSGLDTFGDLLASADSMAWSVHARHNRVRDDLDSLFDWPTVMPCGRVHPNEHTAKSCANCLEWALLWRTQLLQEEIAA